MQKDVNVPLEKWPDLPRRRKLLRLPDFDYSDTGRVYFVTLCARGGGNPFHNQELAEIVVAGILQRSTGQHWLAHAYCLMPDHLHLAISPVAASIPRLMQGFKSYTTRMAWHQGKKGSLWQRNYYDHIARRDEDVVSICNYILANPVRKGLVEDPADWPYSGMPDPVSP